MSLAQGARAATISPTLIRLIETATWPHPAPDPAGIGYNPLTNRLLLTDSEVEEPVSGNPPVYYHGTTLWELSLSGSILAERNLTPWSTEPTGITFSATGPRYWVSDDVAHRIFEVRPGGDNNIGTSDDTWTGISTSTLGDAEGVAYADGKIVTSDGAAQQIHVVSFGANGRFEAGAGDDTVTSFSTASFGQTDPEDVAYDPDSGHLFFGSRKIKTVVETTMTGTLVNTYDLSATSFRNTSGIVIAPTSNDPTFISMYIADRGGDNNTDPNLNDGRIYEFRLRKGGPTNRPPVITNPGNQEDFEGDSVDVDVDATDPEGNPFTWSANGLPAGLSINSSTGRITGTIAAGAAGGSPYSAQVTATDATSGATESFTWVVKDLVPPAAPTGLSTSSATTGLTVDWSNNSEPDLGGYNIYRSATGDPGSFTKLNTAPLPSSDYIDTTATLGATSFYEVRAVDRSGNESTAGAISGIRSKIQFVAMKTKNGSSISTLTIDKPVGLVAGDVLLAGVAVRSAATITAPSGWTKILDHSPSASSTMRQDVFGKVAGASEPSTYGFTLSSSGTAVGTIVAYRGAGLPVALSAGQPNSSSSSITAPSLTPATVGVEVGFFGTRSNTAIAPPAGMLEQAEIAHSNGIAIETADDVVDPGVLGTRVATAGSSAVNVGQVVFLRTSNNTPVVTNPGPQTNFEGDVVSLSIGATDAESEPLTYGATGLPAGLAINPSTGAITGTVSVGASGASLYNTVVSAGDGTTTGTASFTWTIKDLIAPAAPSGFTASSTTTALNIDWADNGEPDFASYDIYRSATGDTGSFVKLNASPLTASAFSDGGAPPGVTSFYEIVALDESGNSSPALADDATRAKISFVGTASAFGSVTNLTIGRPSGVAAGDTLLAVVSIRGTGTLSATGWTKILEHTTSGSPPLKQAVFSKTAGSSEPASYVFAAGSSTVPAAGSITAYRGAASPAAATGGQANASSASITAPTLTATTAQSVEVGFFGTALGTTITPPAGMLEQAETAITAPTNKATVETADDVVDAGSIGTRVATAGSAGVNVGQVVLLKPAGPQPPAITNPGAKESFEGDTVNLQVVATDAEGDPITYGASGLPTGLAIDSNTGIISGTVATGASVISPFTVTVTATDAQGTNNAVFTWTIKDPNAPTPLDIVVAAASDDAEQLPSGAVDISSSDIELVTDGGSVQRVGVRFTNIALPPGATVTSAWIQFQADEASSEATSLSIKAQAIDNAPTFTTTANSISSRAVTTAAVAWAPAPWATVGEAGALQRTPELKTVLQEVVNRPGWASGSAMAFIVTGTGRRVAEPFEGGPLDPKLHIEYTAGSPPPPGNQRPVVTNPGSKSNAEGDAVTLAISASDPESDPITYGATGLPGGLSINTSTGVITGTVATGAATGSPYSVTVTASDAGGPGSANFTWTITNGAPPPAPTTLNVVMTAPADDMEEAASGAIDAGSSDLEIVQEGTLQTVGLRFTGVAIPAGATITNAWIQFQTDEVSTGACNLLVQGEDVDNASAFTTTAFNISSRARTSAGASWAPPDWPTIGDAGAAQRTSNLAAVLQEIVSRPGWASGSAMAFIITGTGKRVAESFEGGPLDPTLHIEYTV